MFRSRAAAISLLLILSVGVDADDGDDLIDVLESPGVSRDPPGAEAPAKQETWDLRLGALGGVSPDYLGSNDYEADFAPYIYIKWKNRVVFTGRSLRVRLINDKPWRLGPIVRLRDGRDEDDNSDIEGLGDDDVAVEVGGFLRYKNGPYRLRLTAAQDVAEAHDGAVINFGAGAQIPLARPWFLLMANVTWGDGSYMNSYFGVTPSESQNSGLRPFRADAGLQSAGFTLSSRVPVWRRLSLVGAFKYERLLGDAADSPVTDDVGDPNQISANLGLIWRF